MNKLTILFLLIGTMAFGQAESLDNGYWMQSEDSVACTISQSNSMQLGTIATINLETGKIDIQKLPVEEASKLSAKLFWEGWEQYFMARIEQERRFLSNDLLKQIKILDERQKLLNDHFLKHYKNVDTTIKSKHVTIILIILLMILIVIIIVMNYKHNQGDMYEIK